ncbi:hypothetical protein ACQ4LE_009928 [Meloidogyne hapla]|uniref:CCHC-type domain-containing protein n=1 Tax=Meloidogyne hapla TaxID=6305 RepID=A0A1I8BVN6_MELHA
MSGSDFAPEFFNSEEKRNFNTIIIQLRSFERSVAQSFRQLEGRIDTIEDSIKKNKDSLIATKDSVTGVRNSLKELQSNLEEKIGKIGKLCKNKGDENIDELEASFIDESVDEINEEENNAEIMTMDPFLGNGAFIGSFDGNPTTSFKKWVEKFKDILSLMTEPTEAQKLARLRFCLAGQARITYDNIDPAPRTLAEALAYLKGKYENGNGKVIARQLLSNCRHAPGESVFEFANRLSDTVRTALSGENEETIKRRLLDEFLDRLLPELQFEVKAQRPQDYANAYEIAQHYELLLAARRNNQISVANLAGQVEALAIQNNKYYKKEKRTCYYCKRQGHIASNCFYRNSDYNPQSFRPQPFERYRNRYGESSQYSNHYYDGEYRPNRREYYENDNCRGFRKKRNKEDYSSSSSREREQRYNNDGSRSPNRRIRFERSPSPRIGFVNLKHHEKRRMDRSIFLDEDILDKNINWR